MNVDQPKAHVLVIDDEESLRDACAQVLTREGYAVVAAADGQQGLEMACAGRPDLILLDLKMPKMAGMVLMDELNQCCPDSVKVVVTAYATVATALEAIRHGAYDFLPKPFTPDELRVMVARCLERRQLVLHNRELLAERERIRAECQADLPERLRRPLSEALDMLERLTPLVGESGQAGFLLRESTVRLRQSLAALEERG